MIKNFFKVTVRYLRKHRGYALLNVAGLAIGLACFLLIMLFVRDEWRYDRHHEHADALYRVVLDSEQSSGTSQGAQSPGAWGPVLQQTYPEVVSFTRLRLPDQTWLMGCGDRQFYEKGVAFVDSTVFEVFTIPLVRGNAETARAAPFTSFRLTEDKEGRDRREPMTESEACLLM